MLQHHPSREISTTVSSKLYAPNLNLASQTPLMVVNFYQHFIFHCLSSFQTTFGLFITYDHSFRLTNLHASRVFMQSFVPQGVHKSVPQIESRRRNLANNRILRKVKMDATNPQPISASSRTGTLNTHKFFLHYRDSFYSNTFSLFTPRKRVNIHRHFILSSTRWLNGRRVPLKRQLRFRRNAKYRKEVTLAKISWFSTLAQLSPHINTNPVLSGKFQKFEKRFLRFNRRSVKRVRRKTFFPRQDLFLNLRRGHKVTLNKQTFFKRSVMRVVKRCKRKLFRTKTTFRRGGQSHNLPLFRFLKLIKRRRQSNFTTQVLRSSQSRPSVRVSQPMHLGYGAVARTQSKKHNATNYYRYVDRGVRRIRFRRQLSNYGSVNSTYNSPFRWLARLNSQIRKRRPRRVVFSETFRQADNFLKVIANTHLLRSDDTTSTHWLKLGPQLTFAQSLAQSRSVLFDKGILTRSVRAPFATAGSSRAHARYKKLTGRHRRSKSYNKKPRTMFRPKGYLPFIGFRFRDNYLEDDDVSRLVRLPSKETVDLNLTKFWHTTTSTLPNVASEYSFKGEPRLSVSRDKLIMSPLFTSVRGSEERVYPAHFHQYLTYFKRIPRTLKRRYVARLLGLRLKKRSKRGVRNRRRRKQRSTLLLRLFPKKNRKKIRTRRNVRQSGNFLEQSGFLQYRNTYRSVQTIVASSPVTSNRLDLGVQETELVSQVPLCPNLETLEISSCSSSTIQNVQLNLINRTRFLSLVAFKQSPRSSYDNPVWNNTLVSLVRRAVKNSTISKRSTNRRARALRHPALVSPNKTNFISSSVGFLFLQADTLYRRRLNKQRLNKHRYSFFYSDDLKRTLLRSRRSYTASLWSKLSNNRPTSKASNSSLLDTPTAVNSNALLILSSTQKALLRRTSFKYTKRSDLFYRRDVRLRRIKFKPGYSRIWRRARRSIKMSLNINARYQHKLTRHLVRMTRLAKNSQVFVTELVVRNVLLNSSFVFDNVAATTLLDNHLVYLNGILVTNPNLSLFKGDFLQLIVNLKYYILFKWLRNWNRFKRLRLARLAYSKFRKARNSQHKQRSRNFPNWILATRVKHRDVPNYLEVDFFTLSAFVIYEPSTGSDFHTKNLLEDRTEILNMYNWKYIN